MGPHHFLLDYSIPMARMLAELPPCGRTGAYAPSTPGVLLAGGCPDTGGAAFELSSEQKYGGMKCRRKADLIMWFPMPMVAGT